MTETDLQNLIRLNISDIAVTFRANVGRFFTEDGRVISTGLPAGFSDLFGYRLADNKIFFIEVKLPKGKVSEKQKHFLETMKLNGCLCGVARSVEEARKIVRGELSGNWL